MAEFASNGKANAALTTGIIGTAGVGLGLLNGGLNGLFGGWRNGSCGCNEDHVVDRYEAAQAARIAELETEVKLRDANTYADQKMLEMYKYSTARSARLKTLTQLRRSPISALRTALKPSTPTSTASRTNSTVLSETKPRSAAAATTRSSPTRTRLSTRRWSRMSRPAPEPRRSRPTIRSRSAAVTAIEKLQGGGNRRPIFEK